MTLGEIYDSFIWVEIGIIVVVLFLAFTPTVAARAKDEKTKHNGE